MTCCQCSKVALYRVGSNGYCKEHRVHAVKLRRVILHGVEKRRTAYERGEREQFGNVSDWWKGRTIGAVNTK